MRNFSIYRSSAGSGKTFTLVKEYLSLIMKDESPFSFKYVLAVTFTNKAASEMKERVLGSLNAFAYKATLSKGEQTMFDLLKKDLQIGDELIKEKARNILSAILHNYGDFSITTIDKFTLKIVRAFAIDLKLPLNFDIELDDTSLINKALDGLISKVGENQDLTTTLLAYSRFQAAEEKAWNVEQELKKIAPQLLQEKGYLHIEKIRQFDLSYFLEQNKILSKQISIYENELQLIGEKSLNIIHAKGLDGSELSGGTKGVYGFFNKLAKKDLQDIFSHSALKEVDNKKWYSTKCSRQEREQINQISDELQSLLKNCKDYIEKNSNAYQIQILMRNNLFGIALLNEIEKIIDELRKENSSVHISEFNKRILDIVLTQPVPFIYERIGEKYKHYLIDEFQDTSVLQWQNLLPLLDNSLASNYKNLIVGDAKQAIYRWRGGDAEQFIRVGNSNFISANNAVQARMNSINRNAQEQILDQNFRSSKEVIDFNNVFFEKIINLLPSNFKEYYKDFFQKSNFSNSGGYVSVKKIAKDSKEDYVNCTLDNIKTIVNDALQRGYKYADIAILIRKNKTGSVIAQFLTANNIPVVSSDSLLLNNNQNVQLIIALIQLSFNSKDRKALLKVLTVLHYSGLIQDNLYASLLADVKNENIFFSFLSSLGIQFKNSQHLSLLENIQQWCFSLKINTNCPYVVQLLDIIQQYTTQHGIDVALFLQWWDEKKEKFCVQMGGGENAVTISTIHKAKGLEYPIVVLPFNDDKIRANDFIWLDLNNQVLPCLFTKATSSLNNTEFANIYNEEKNKTFLDSINVLYVAFTRAKNEMYITHKSVKKSKELATNVSELIDLVYPSPDTMFYEVGLKGKKYEKEKTEQQFISPTETPVSNWRSHIKISKQAPVIWNEINSKEYGNLVHTIFSKINHQADVDNAMSSTLSEGLFSADLRCDIKNKILSLLNLPEINALFQSGVSIKKEQDILCDDGSVIRPDRLVECNNTIYLLDFKTGKKQESHQKQMKHYAAKVFEIEGKLPEAYLLYLENNEISRVV